MTPSGVIYCSCGHKLWCEARFEEEDLLRLIFFDNVESSETYGEQITQCPGCGGLSFAERLLEPPHTDV
jgi:hypothetical protein